MAVLVERAEAADEFKRQRDGYLARLDECVVEEQRQEVRAITAERERDEARAEADALRQTNERLTDVLKLMHEENVCKNVYCGACREAEGIIFPETVDPIDLGGLDNPEEVARILDARAAAHGSPAEQADGHTHIGHWRPDPPEPKPDPKDTIDEQEQD